MTFASPLPSNQDYQQEKRNYIIRNDSDINIYYQTDNHYNNIYI